MADDPNKKTALAPLPTNQRIMWNNFVDYLDKQGIKGSESLDNKDHNLGLYYLSKYKSITPGFNLSYQDVPRVQADLQNYRTNLVNQWKAGKMVPTPDIKSEADIMGGLSPVDGWLGSKTSSYKFPVAVATNADGSTTNYGVNTAQYDKDRGLK